MKKILFALAAAAMVLGAASCQKENLGKINGITKVGKTVDVIKVVAGPDTRLAIDGETLTPAFEVDDEIFGWDDEGLTYTYKCTAVEEATGIATFSRISEQGPSAEEGTIINLIYAPGSKAEDIAENALVVDLSQQGEILPVVMSGSGAVDAEGNCKVIFKNDVAIVEVKDALFPWVAEGEEFGIEFYGKYNSLKFELDEDGAIAVKPADEGWISGTVKAKANSESKISAKFAVPADGSDILVSIKAKAADGSAYAFSDGIKKISVGKYIKVPGKVFTPQYVAHINQRGYLLLSKAVEAANASKEDVTITMLENVEVESGVTTINNAAGKKVTLDLNGKEIKSQFKINTDFEVADETGKGVIEAAESTLKVGEENNGVKATLTVNGGTIKALDGNYAIAADGTKNGDQPTVLVKKATLIAEKGNATRTRYASMTFGDETEGEINVSSSKGFWISYTPDVVVNKGSFISTERAMYFGNSSSGATINGGEFITEGPCFAYNSKTVNPTIIINGGFFTWKNTEDFAQEANTNVKLSGGYFSNIVPEKYVTTGHFLKESATYPGYPYEVAILEDNSIIKVGEEKFENLDDAITKVNEATTATVITVLQNIAVTDSIEFTTTAPLTLDLNGCSIVASNLTTAHPVIRMDHEGVNLTIVDKSESGEGYLDQTFNGEAFTLIINTGTLTIESGAIKNTSSNGYGRFGMKIAGTEGKSAPVVNIKGGYIRGGRAISIGSGNSVVPVINITGGLIEGTYNTNNDKTYQYGTLAFQNDGYLCTITGGILLSKWGPCFYTAKKAENSTLIFGDPDDSSKISYLYTTNGEWCFRSGSKDASKRVFVYNAYCNNPTEKNSIFIATGATATALDPKVKDAEGREYTHLVSVSSD